MFAEVPPEDARSLLKSWREGDLAARDRLFSILYPDLQRSAAALLRHERGVSFSTADLVNEAVMRLILLNRIDWNDRAHFMALASRMMRRALLDYVRAKRADKRAHEKIALSTGIHDEPDLEVEALNAALNRLAIIDHERADIVEMRYFGGMEIADIAVVLGMSESTVKRRWNTARIWLLEALTHDGG